MSRGPLAELRGTRIIYRNAGAAILVAFLEAPAAEQRPSGSTHCCRRIPTTPRISFVPAR
jgi:hypothetical protein